MERPCPSTTYFEEIGLTRRCIEPVPARLKEWAYAGFAINLASALIAHLSVGGGHRRVLGALVLLLAPPAGHAGERLTAFQGQVESLRWF